MKRLSEKDEAIMRIVWQKGRVFSKDVREALPDPKPHISTVTTLMRRLIDKKFLSYEDFGGTFVYFAVVSMDEYNSKVIKPLVKGLFGNSLKNAVAFFAQDKELSADDLREIIQMIEHPKKGKS